VNIGKQPADITIVYNVFGDAGVKVLLTKYSEQKI